MTKQLISMHEMMVHLEELIGEKLDWSIGSDKGVFIPDYSLAVLCTGVEELFDGATARKMGLEE
jgi:hypothetical protein